MSIELQRWGHSCVRIGGEHPLVIDPGVYSDAASALAGAAGVLITHEHADHVDVGAVSQVAGGGVPVHGPSPALEALASAGAPTDMLHEVLAGDRFTLAGHDVQVLGQWHEVIHPDVPRFVNVGYLVDDVLLHPGDAYVERADGRRLDTLLVPVSGPWLRLTEVIDWVRRVRPRQVVAIHDALASPAGQQLMGGWIERLCDTPVIWLAPGESIELG